VRSPHRPRGGCSNSCGADVDAVSRFAANVRCAVFLGFGEHDIPEQPHDDPAFYTGSGDVTLFVLEGGAHCHNFAPTRTVLWDRLGRWAADARAR
jgi:hypothetical protein